VRLSRRNLESNAKAIAEYLEIRQQDRAISSLPFHYSYGMSVLNSHLCAGASVVVTDM
jgi:long-subunit acyl-CoA synthetase (AMP-forming)